MFLLSKYHEINYTTFFPLNFPKLYHFSIFKKFIKVFDNIVDDIHTLEKKYSYSNLKSEGTTCKLFIILSGDSFA